MLQIEPPPLQHPSERGYFASVKLAHFLLLPACLLSFSVLCRAQSGSAQQPAPEQKQRVTTTVVVHGTAEDNYLPETVSVGTIDGTPLKETPLSATVVTRDLINDQNARLLSDLVKNDASIGEDYAPVGYYGDYAIRGFPIDLASGIQIDGMTIAGEQDVPLENKERVEFLKGIAGVESGVASAGGFINYVTKRPTMVKTADLATDHRGSSFGTVDLGWLFGGSKRVGTRINLAGEKIQSYVNNANGWRAMGSAAADWKLNSTTILKGDFEYQHKVQRSVSGYQLLGGTVVPDFDSVFPSTMLGEQAWSKPNTFDTFNTNARLDYDVASAWHLFADASLSHSLIDDNVVYAYGCSYQAACQGSGGTSPDYFFAPDGGYDIYDYRDPGELRVNAQAKAILIGRIKTGSIHQDLAVGGELFRRSVRQPGAPPADASSNVQDGAVYAYVGSENIFQPIAAFPFEDPLQTAGPQTLWEDNHQSALVVQDRVHLPANIELLAGGRYDSLRDHNYSLAATSPGSAPILTHRRMWLPQYAVTYTPVGSLTLYANYGVLLSLGPQSPWWVDNGSQFLSAFLSRQAEVGAKFAPAKSILLTAALYRLRAPYFYPKAIEAPDDFCSAEEFLAPGDLCFEQRGRETHNGAEINVEGKATSWLRLSASASAIRALSSDTGSSAFDNKQVLNVPHLRTAVFADFVIPGLHGLHLMPGWGYTGRKEATRDDSVSVAGYNLFNFGARYTPGGEQGRISLRLYADNIADKRYWKDTGASYGDTFIHLGAPAAVRLSAHYTF